MAWYEMKIWKFYILNIFTIAFLSLCLSTFLWRYHDITEYYYGEASTIEQFLSLLTCEKCLTLKDLSLKKFGQKMAVQAVMLW